MQRMSLGLEEALRLTLGNTRPLPMENVSLIDSIDRVAATDLSALVDSPSMDSSRKDGYAVISTEIARASTENPVRLSLLGSIAAGGEADINVQPGTTVRVLTGARIPPGADAVVAEEFVEKNGSGVWVRSYAEPKNILRRGSDVAVGSRILQKGETVSPVMAGLLAAAGHSTVPVFQNPLVGILGTGDEIVEPGKTLAEGQLYASNIMTIAGWCARYGIKVRTSIVGDNHDALVRAARDLSSRTDALITSGGAWTGDHDLVAGVLAELGWQKIFHRIRIGPGKAAGFGLLADKPVFVLAGGPPSNLMGFLQVALPGLLSLSGHNNPGLPTIHARLASELRGGETDWTDFFFGTLAWEREVPEFHPMIKRSRLQSLARASGIAAIPEGKEFLPKGSIISVQVLR